MNLILASKSPRRREILTSLGVPFTVMTADTDESSPITDPCRLVEELALRKGLAVRDLLSPGDLSPDTVILSSDTVVSVDGEILGKPRSAADAVRMLRLLSGREHQVISGVCLLGDGIRAVSHEVTDVCFDRLSEEEIAAYVASGEPMDKAGAYAIQGHACAWISGIRGDYFNVVGLPVHLLCRMYRENFGENFY